MNIKKLALTSLVSIISAVMVIAVYAIFFDTDKDSTVLLGGQNDANVKLANYEMIRSGKITPVDFTFAASLTTPAVVHVSKRYTETSAGVYDPFRDFFGEGSPFFEQPRERTQVASGSGVIISADGYIVTNNHVVSQAEDLQVRLYDKRTVPATLIGSDPSTDLALIKVDVDNLPVIPFGDSDSAQIGEWVLAVGNPFDLTSTVTAGIISAKGRNINILRQQSKAPIESFIQTDAAVNPGNSGGALVNTKGELVGINTAIATPTGTYAGYSFAVPVNIVKKVVSDLMKYGIVQRAFLGVQIRDINSELAKELDIKNLRGAYIAEVNARSGAEEAGLQEGDIIRSINGSTVNSVAELQEQISLYRPGDKVNVRYIRNNKEYGATVTLTNSNYTTDVVEKEAVNVMSTLGLDLENLSKEEKNELDINYGVKVKEIYNGKIAQFTRIKKGFIITKIDREEVKNVNELMKKLEKKEKNEAVYIEGFYPEYPSQKYAYAFVM